MTTPQRNGRPGAQGDTLADILTPAQVAERLHLSEATVYRMCRRHELPVVRLGRSWRVDGRRLAGMFTT